MQVPIDVITSAFLSVPLDSQSALLASLPPAAIAAALEAVPPGDAATLLLGMEPQSREGAFRGASAARAGLLLRGVRPQLVPALLAGLPPGRSSLLLTHLTAAQLEAVAADSEVGASAFSGIAPGAALSLVERSAVQSEDAAAAMLDLMSADMAAASLAGLSAAAAASCVQAMTDDASAAALAAMDPAAGAAVLNALMADDAASAAACILTAIETATAAQVLARAASSVSGAVLTCMEPRDAAVLVLALSKVAPLACASTLAALEGRDAALVLGAMYKLDHEQGSGEVMDSAARVIEEVTRRDASALSGVFTSMASSGQQELAGAILRAVPPATAISLGSGATAVLERHEVESLVGSMSSADKRRVLLDFGSESVDSLGVERVGELLSTMAPDEAAHTVAAMPRVAVTQLSADTLCDILGGSNHSASVAMLHALDNAKAEEIVEQAVTRGIGVGDLLGGEGDAAAPDAI